MNIQEFMQTFWGHSCYAWCLTKYFSAYTEEGIPKNFFLPKTELQLMSDSILFGWKQGFIDDDCYVSKPIEYIKLLVRKAPKDVTKVPIKELSELPEGVWIVEYKKKPTDKDSHFVIANSKEVLFDPAGESQTVKVGKPFSYRKFIY